MTPLNAGEEMVNQDASRFRVAGKMSSVPDFAEWHSFEAGFKGRVVHLWQIAKTTSRAGAARYAMGQ
jgi:hypothetical protein